MGSGEAQDKLRRSLRDFVLRLTPIQSIWGTVSEVDWDAKTMTVNDGKIEYFDVLLSIDGSLQDLKKPKVGSKVLIGSVENKDAARFMLLCMEYEEWQLNGDANGGITITPELQKQLDIMSKRIDGVIDALKNAKAVTDQSGSGLQLSIVAGLQLIIQKEDFSNIESETIKHG